MDALKQRGYDAARAKDVLENEQFQRSFEMIEAEVLQQWKSSPARDAEGREKLWSYLQLMSKFKATLEATINSGRLAELDLQHRTALSEASKRVRRFLAGSS